MKIQFADKNIVLAALLAICAGFLLLWLSLTATAQAQTPEPASESAYADVPPDAWYRESVVSLEEQGIFEGTDCEEGFCPGEPLKRWQMAVWLVRILDDQEPALINESRFADVDNHADWVHFIDRLADLEVTTGCNVEPLRYCPDSAVTRSQMAAFLYRAFSLPDAENPAGFVDVAEDSWAFNYINALAASGITTGCKSEPFSYCPSSSVTKAQMAAFLYRALEWRAEQEQTTEEPDNGIEETPSEVNNNPNNISGYDPDVFYTEENELSRFVKHEIVDKHAEENPWLLAVWNHTNHSDFKYIINDNASYASAEVSGNSGVHISVPRPWMSTASILGVTVVHEMAHIYTYVDVLDTDQHVSTAIAHLYFNSLSDDNSACPSDELYADAAQLLVNVQGNADASYWQTCRDVPSSVTPEAVAVVRSAFDGEIPEWFYDTFQKADGSLAYEAIWAAILDVDGSFISVRAIVGHQLENEFGGYCSKGKAYSALFGHSQLTQPWRDGGCSDN